MNGVLVGLMSSIFTYPLEFAHTRMTVDVASKSSERLFTGLRDFYSKIYKHDSTLGLYRGFGIYAAGEILFGSLYFSLYKLTNKIFCSEKLSNEFYALIALTISTALLTVTIWYPFDTVKARLMMQGGSQYKM